MAENTKKAAKIDSKIVILIAVGLIGAFLLIYGSFASSGKDKTTDVSVSNTKVLDPDTYAEEVEIQVIKICEEVTGVGTVDAVVSLKGGYRSVYATDSQSSSSGYKNSMVLVGSGSSEGAVLVCYENPEISGIGIVLSCKENDGVRNSIISLVSAAFNVGTNKIYVAFGR